MEEVYLPIEAPIPRSSTRRTRQLVRPSRQVRGYNPLCPAYSKQLSWTVSPCSRLQITTPPSRGDFHAGLLPVQSPLLRQSRLISFPPLNNMLKFRGSSCRLQIGITKDSPALRTGKRTDENPEGPTPSACSRPSVFPRRRLFSGIWMAILVILKRTCGRGWPPALIAFEDLMTRGSCNSHCLSQFAAFFLVVGT